VATDKELYALLAELGIETKVTHHPPVFTVDESKRLRGEIEGGHAKNLLLRNKKGELWLVVALESTPVDLKQLGGALGSGRLSFANPEQLGTVLGISAGAVSPFAVINDREGKVRVALERRMLELESLNFHPLRNDATVTIRSRDLIRFLEACGHPASEVDIAS
jgi:Ala-tRNA(Pro) deacylase